MGSWWERFNQPIIWIFHNLFQIQEQKELQEIIKEGDENNWSVGEQEELVAKLNKVAELKKAIDVDVDVDSSLQVSCEKQLIVQT